MPEKTNKQKPCLVIYAEDIPKFQGLVAEYVSQISAKNKMPVETCCLPDCTTAYLAFQLLKDKYKHIVIVSDGNFDINNHANHDGLEFLAMIKTACDEKLIERLFLSSDENLRNKSSGIGATPFSKKTMHEDFYAKLEQVLNAYAKHDAQQ